MDVEFLKNINCWNDFFDKVSVMSKKAKGDAFEHLTKLYFKINPLYRSMYKNVWLLDEVPYSVLEYLEIPSNPNQVYKEFKGMGDWLGTYTIQPQKREYLSFKEAKVILSKENMRTSKDWREFCKSNKRPLNIPSDPDSKYEDEWKGWADFLGKDN